MQFVSAEGVTPELCGSSESAEEALKHLSEVKPDLILVDLSLPGMNGLELVSELKNRCPEIPCVMLSGHRSEMLADQARDAGAKAYVSKSKVGELVGVLRKVLKGASHFPK